MNNSRKMQKGGTLVGFILGLVVGLAIAVVVAITINKTPVPLMSRSVKVDKPGELTVQQSADPNKPLYGSREAARDAARDFVKETPPKPTVEENTLPAATPAAASGSETAAPEDKWIYYLQAGAFRAVADAEGEKAKLALQGYEATIQERPSETGTLYRVRLGPYTQLDAMNKVRSKLTESGIDVAVIRVAK